MDFKNTLVKSIVAVLCVVAICITMVSVAGTYSDAVIEASKLSGTASADAEASPDEPVDPDVPDGGEEVIGEDSSVEDGTETEDPTDAAESDTTDPNEAGKTDSDKPTQNTDKQTSSEPKTQAEIIAYYNDAVAKAVKAKVGYNKTRTTDNEKLDGSIGLQAMKSLVYKFMGIGAENAYSESVAKGNWGDRAYLLNSKLTTADGTATCVKSGANYVITLKLKNGASSANEAKPTTAANTALDKCGICVGTEDKGYFDHKTASVIYDAIAGTYAGAEVKESYSNATVKATINATTGNVVSIVVEWNQSVTLSKLLGMSATATGTSHVTYKDFKY